MNNSNLKMNASVVGEESTQIITKCNSINESFTVISNTINKLDSWQSSSKNEYVNKIKRDMDKLREVVNSIEEFGHVANNAAQRVNNIEDAIKKAAQNNN